VLSEGAAARSAWTHRHALHKQWLQSSTRPREGAGGTRACIGQTAMPLHASMLFFRGKHSPNSRQPYCIRHTACCCTYCRGRGVRSNAVEDDIQSSFNKEDSLFVSNGSTNHIS
jgi:hypothetical protein